MPRTPTAAVLELEDLNQMVRSRYKRKIPYGILLSIDFLANLLHQQYRQVMVPCTAEMPGVVSRMKSERTTSGSPTPLEPYQWPTLDAPSLVEASFSSM
jgi:hypothetical protein